MRFKLIIAFVGNDKTELVLKTARDFGATGATVITSARGEGIERPRTFLGLTLEAQRDVVLMLVEEHLSRTILEAVAGAAGFDVAPGTGIAFQIDVEDAVGVRHQMEKLVPLVEEKI